MSRSVNIIRGLLISVLVIALLMLLRDFLVPFAYGLLIALIVYPVCAKLESKGVSRGLAIALSILLVAIILGAVLILFIYQLSIVKDEIPGLLLRLKNLYPEAQEWIRSTFNLSLSLQNDLVDSVGKDVSSNVGSLVSGSFVFAAQMIFYLVVVPLYSVLLLIYRRQLVRFLASLLGDEYRKDLPAVLSETIHMYFNYIKGMLGVYLTVGILNSIGLLIVGVDYAILFGMVTAFMTIIPYVGIIVSSVLPIAMIWAETNNVLYPLAVVGIFAVVQYLEANIIFPYIVGKHIGINTLVSIIAIFLGGVLWGVSGMLLFLPFTAILKIIAAHVPALKPLNELLEIPPAKK